MAVLATTLLRETQVSWEETLAGTLAADRGTLQRNDLESWMLPQVKEREPALMGKKVTLGGAGNADALFTVR